MPFSYLCSMRTVSFRHNMLYFWGNTKKNEEKKNWKHHTICEYGTWIRHQITVVCMLHLIFINCNTSRATYYAVHSFLLLSLVRRTQKSYNNHTNKKHFQRCAHLVLWVGYYTGNRLKEKKKMKNRCVCKYTYPMHCRI